MYTLKYIETYFYYDKDNEVVLCDNWADTNTDKMRLENKVIFETEEAAERYAEYQKAKKEYTSSISSLYLSINSCALSLVLK